MGAVAGAASGAVGYASSIPCHLNYRGPISDSGRYFARMLADAFINAGASTAQTYGTNAINGQPTSPMERGTSVLMGGGTGFVFDAAMGPGWGGFARSFATEVSTNVLVNSASKNVSTPVRKNLSRNEILSWKLQRMEKMFQYN